MPAITASLVKGESWNDKISAWRDVLKMENTYVEDNVSSLFGELMRLINNRYAALEDIICKELKAYDTQLTFVYNRLMFLDTSGQTAVPSGSTLNN